MGTMSVDAYYASTGIKLKTNMYTSTVFEGHMKINGSRHINVRFRLPQEKSEIFSMSSELVVMNNREEEVQKSDTKSDMKCFWNDGFQYLGLKVCAYYEVPNLKDSNSNMILSGPMKFNISLPKSDVTATTYVFDYKWTTRDNLTEVLMQYNTPGSLLEKFLSANLTVDLQNKHMQLTFNSNDTNIVSNGRFKTDAADKHFYLDIITNGKKNLDFGTSLSKKDIKNGKMFIPRMYIAVDNERISELNGECNSIGLSSIVGR